MSVYWEFKKEEKQEFVQFHSGRKIESVGFVVDTLAIFLGLRLFPVSVAPHSHII